MDKVLVIEQEPLIIAMDMITSPFSKSLRSRQALMAKNSDAFKTKLHFMLNIIIMMKEEFKANNVIGNGDKENIQCNDYSKRFQLG